LTTFQHLQYGRHIRGCVVLRLNASKVLEIHQPRRQQVRPQRVFIFDERHGPSVETVRKAVRKESPERQYEEITSISEQNPACRAKFDANSNLLPKLRNLPDAEFTLQGQKIAAPGRPRSNNPTGHLSP
jgi:hypothetical protein